MLIPPHLEQPAKPTPPPGSKGMSFLTKVSIRGPGGIPVAICTVRVDAAALKRHLKGAPQEGRGVRALELIGRGRIGVWMTSEYLEGMGSQLRHKRLEGWLRKAWPTPGEDLMTRPACRAYIDAAGIEINPPDVHGRFVEPGVGLWFQAPGQPWRRFDDPSLAQAYAQSELASADQDADYHAALVKALDELLKD